MGASASASSGRIEPNALTEAKKNEWFVAASLGECETVAQLLAEHPNLIDAVDSDVCRRDELRSCWTALHLQQRSRKNGFAAAGRELLFLDSCVG